MVNSRVEASGVKRGDPFRSRYNDDVPLRPGLTVRMARSVFDMRGQVRQLLREDPSEARLLLFAVLSDMVFVLSWSVKTLVSPTSPVAGLSGSDVVIWLLVALMFRTMLIYALAAFIGVIMRFSGGPASLHETRTGVFWGVFVAAPFGLAVSELAVVINALQDRVPLFAFEGVQLLPYWLGMVPFVWFVAKGAAAANRIDNAIPLFGILSLAAVTGVFVAKVVLV